MAASCCHHNYIKSCWPTSQEKKLKLKFVKAAKTMFSRWLIWTVEVFQSSLPLFSLESDGEAPPSSHLPSFPPCDLPHLLLSRALTLREVAVRVDGAEKETDASGQRALLRQRFAACAPHRQLAVAAARTSGWFSLAHLGTLERAHQGLPDGSGSLRPGQPASAPARLVTGTPRTGSARSTACSVGWSAGAAGAMWASSNRRERCTGGIRA